MTKSFLLRHLKCIHRIALHLRAAEPLHSDDIDHSTTGMAFGVKASFHRALWKQQNLKSTKSPKCVKEKMETHLPDKF